MSYFVSEETHRISLKEFDGSDEWVDIKDELTDKDERALAVALGSRGARFVDRGDGLMEVEGNADLESYADVILARCIRGWSFVHPKNHQPIPVTPQNIARLKGVSTFIVAQAQEHYNAQKLSEQQVKNSNGPSSLAPLTAAPSPPSWKESSSDDGSASTQTHPSALVAASALPY